MLQKGNEVLVRAHQRDLKRYGRLRFCPYGERTLAYRLVRGGPRGRYYHYWLVCGLIDVCGPQMQSLKYCTMVAVSPIDTAEERNSLRSALATVARGAFLFQEGALSH